MGFSFYVGLILIETRPGRLKFQHKIHTERPLVILLNIRLVETSFKKEAAFAVEYLLETVQAY